MRSKKEFSLDQIQKSYKTLNQINDVIKGFGEKIEGIGISCPGPLELDQWDYFNTTKPSRGGIILN